MKNLLHNEFITVSISHNREIEINERMQITLNFKKDLGTVENVKFLFNRFGESKESILSLNRIYEDDENIRYHIELEFDKIGKFAFCFLFSLNGKDRAIKLSRETYVPINVGILEDYNYWVILVTNKNLDIPLWFKDAIVYQIFIDRFFKSEKTTPQILDGRNYRIWGETPYWMQNRYGDFHNNDFFGGNLKGITEKLEYLQNIGVSILYISPINLSNFRYDRYAASDHMEIDPEVGNFDDLKELYDKANTLNIRIILDIAFNHCHSDNPIFQEALRNPYSSKRGWFHFDNHGNYRYWFNMFRDMPVFNQHNKEFQEYIYGEHGVVQKFAEYVDGFRLDVSEELEHFFLEGIRNRANVNGRHIIIGECWSQPPTEIMGKGLDSFTNYLYADAILKYVAFGDHQYFTHQIMDCINSLPQDSINCSLTSLDTHDTVRALTILNKECMRKGYDRIWDIDKPPSKWHTNIPSGILFNTLEFRTYENSHNVLSPEKYQKAKKLLKLSAIIQFFVPGNPCIYYGTEIGMHGYKDPFNRQCYNWENGDMELYEFYSRLGKIRKLFNSEGTDFKFITVTENVLVFERSSENNIVKVIINRSSKQQKIEELENYCESTEFKHSQILTENTSTSILEPFSGIVVVNY